MEADEGVRGGELAERGEGELKRESVGSTGSKDDGEKGIMWKTGEGDDAAARSMGEESGERGELDIGERVEDVSGCEGDKTSGEGMGMGRDP